MNTKRNTKPFPVVTHAVLLQGTVCDISIAKTGVLYMRKVFS